MAQTPLKTELLCTPQHFLDTDLGIAELMPDLSWISSNPVEAKQHDKTGQSLVCHARYLRVHVDLDSDFCADNHYCRSARPGNPEQFSLRPCAALLADSLKSALFSDWRSAALRRTNRWRCARS